MPERCEGVGRDAGTVVAEAVCAPGQVDMYAYTMAASHHEVKHAVMRHYMISSPDDSNEGWQTIDALQSMSCRNPVVPDGPPTFLHACHHYRACASSHPNPRFAQTSDYLAGGCSSA